MEYRLYFNLYSSSYQCKGYLLTTDFFLPYNLSHVLFNSYNEKSFPVKEIVINVNKNRLADAVSPYLLQHADNPVDWYPWGEEAFAKARNEDKPIFLSVGYSACHWCHVMERESFTDTTVAAYLNEHFISIKVDREERPDVDEIYMTAVQMMTGSRKTGYKWIERYQSQGIEGLYDLSRRPHRSPDSMDRDIENIVVHLHHQYPYWGRASFMFC